MARSVDSSTRIKRLEGAVERAKALHKAVELDAKPMTELIGFSWPTLRDWCNDIPALTKLKCFKRGGNGVKWEFKPLTTCQVILDHFRGEAATRASKNRDMQRRVGVQLPDSEESASLDEVRKLVQLTIELLKQKADQGFYTPTEQMIEFIEGYNRAVIEGIMGVGTEADPTGRLDPETSEAVNELLRSVAVRTHSKAEAFIEEYRARTQQAGVGIPG